MKTITKRFKFDFAHHLPNYQGKCQRPHGHTGVLEVTLKEDKYLSKFWQKYPKMIIDFYVMKKGIEETVLTHIDHRDLNDFLEIPTAESLLDWCVAKLLDYFKTALYRVRIYESDSSYVTWTLE